MHKYNMMLALNFTTKISGNLLCCDAMSLLNLIHCHVAALLQVVLSAIYTTCKTLCITIKLGLPFI